MSQKINKQQLALEFISVVFAVVLALILNGWRESSALDENLSNVKASIKKEVIRNDSLIKFSHKYRGQLLRKFYRNENLIFKVAVSELDFDVNDNKALRDLFETVLLFGEKTYYERVLVLEIEANRVLVLDKNVFDLKVEEDTLKLYGIGNVQLRLPDISNRSWDLAQATGTIVEMDIQLVDQLSVVHTLIETYLKTSDNALQLVYKGEQKGLQGVIEDLYSLETKIIRADSVLLSTLNNH